MMSWILVLIYIVGFLVFYLSVTHNVIDDLKKDDDIGVEIRKYGFLATLVSVSWPLMFVLCLIYYLFKIFD